MKSRKLAVLFVAAASALVGSTLGMANAQDEKEMLGPKSEFVQKGEIQQQVDRSATAPPADEKYGYSCLQGSYAPMGKGAASKGAGCFKIGPERMYYQVDLDYQYHGSIGGIPGDVYKTTVGGQDDYLLFSDYTYSDGYARVVTCKNGYYTPCPASKCRSK